MAISERCVVPSVPRDLCEPDANVRWRSLAALAGALLVGLGLLWTGLTGCGRSGETLGEVRGEVTFQGQAVSEGLILFKNAEKGIHMTARLHPSGTYRVKMAEGSGLPLGTYQVAVTPPLADLQIGPVSAPPKSLTSTNIPQKYRRYETSGLTLTVEQGENQFNVNMSP